MKYRYIHISAALFLVAGMAMQFVLSYQQALRNVQENIDPASSTVLMASS